MRYAALDAIDRTVAADATLGTPALADAVLTAARLDPDPVVRGHAALASIAFRSLPGATARAARLAAAYAHERSAAVRWHEMWALYRGYAFVAPRSLLLRGLRDRSDLVRIEAVRAWGKRGGPGALQLLQPLLADPSSSVGQRATFAAHNVWVTPFAENERYAAGDYPNQHSGGAGLPAWTAQDRSVVDTDIVLWHSFGVTHIPRPEDWPVMPVEYSGFSLVPFGFFDRNPALDVPPTTAGEVHCHAE